MSGAALRVLSSASSAFARAGSGAAGFAGASAAAPARCRHVSNANLFAQPFDEWRDSFALRVQSHRGGLVAPGGSNRPALRRITAQHPMLFKAPAAGQAQNPKGPSEGAPGGGSSRGPLFNAASPRKEVTALFERFALSRTVDDEAALSFKGLRCLLRALGERPSASRIQRLLSEADQNRNGTIELDEFLARWDFIVAHADAKDTARSHFCRTDDEGPYSNVSGMIEAFHVLDGDGDGVLSAKDLSTCLSTIGRQMSLEDATAVIDNCGGKVTLQQFVGLAGDPKSGASSWRLRASFRSCLIIGAPGSGKKALSEALQRHANILPLDCPTALLQEVSAGTEIGYKAAKAMQDGRLLPSSQVIKVLQKRIAHKSAGCYVAISGFPQSLKNVTDFVQSFGRPDFAVFLDVPEEALALRLTEDQQVPEEGTVGRRVERFFLHRQHIEDELVRYKIPVYNLDGMKRTEEVYQQLLCVNPSFSRFVNTDKLRNIV